MTRSGWCLVIAGALVFSAAASAPPADQSIELPAGSVVTLAVGDGPAVRLEVPEGGTVTITAGPGSPLPPPVPPPDDDDDDDAPDPPLPPPGPTPRDELSVAARDYAGAPARHMRRLAEQVRAGNIRSDRGVFDALRLTMEQSSGAFGTNFRRATERAVTDGDITAPAAYADALERAADAMEGRP